MVFAAGDFHLMVIRRRLLLSLMYAILIVAAFLSLLCYGRWLKGFKKETRD